jgi:hypothetical protein
MPSIFSAGIGNILRKAETTPRTIPQEWQVNERQCKPRKPQGLPARREKHFMRKSYLRTKRNLLFIFGPWSMSIHTVSMAQLVSFYSVIPVCKHYLEQYGVLCAKRGPVLFVRITANSAPHVHTNILMLDQVKNANDPSLI